MPIGKEWTYGEYISIYKLVANDLHVAAVGNFCFQGYAIGKCQGKHLFTVYDATVGCNQSLCSGNNALKFVKLGTAGEDDAPDD